MQRQRDELGPLLCRFRRREHCPVAVRHTDILHHHAWEIERGTLYKDEAHSHRKLLQAAHATKSIFDETSQHDRYLDWSSFHAISRIQALHLEINTKTISFPVTWGRYRSAKEDMRTCALQGFGYRPSNHTCHMQEPTTSSKTALRQG